MHIRYRNKRRINFPARGIYFKSEPTLFFTIFLFPPSKIRPYFHIRVSPVANSMLDLALRL